MLHQLWSTGWNRKCTITAECVECVVKYFVVSLAAGRGDGVREEGARGHERRRGPVQCGARPRQAGLPVVGQVPAAQTTLLQQGAHGKSALTGCTR